MTNVEKELAKKLIQLFDDEDDSLEIVEEGDWTQDHKYQHMETVAKYEGKFYSFNQSRSGSYHTDWYYNDTEVYEVEPVTKTITVTTYVLKK